MALPSRSKITVQRRDLPRQARAPIPEPAADGGAASPIVKWAGGKSRLLDELCSRAPERYRRYFEPFVGGAALYFRLRPRWAVLGDSNPDLINMYRCVAWNVEAVIRRLTRHREAHGEDHYYAVRERWNRPGGLSADVDRAAAFIYLNKTCYNGLWRVNSRGEFNVPLGRYEDPAIFDRLQMGAASRLLQRAELRAGHFADAVAGAGAGDFVYFDPPYHPLSVTAHFTSYTSSSFGADDQRELARVARELVRRGCSVLVSNSDTEFVRELYRGFAIDVVDCGRAINSKASARGPQRELLIRGV
ncbi:MAG TPA: DNA adenine methylase [Candidatus Acidoferrum sp.]|nr:DNA adenine methylase [Candidatus Acidoferrum sp.]